MRKLLLFLASPAFAAITITNIQISPTDQQAVVTYTTNYSGACTFAASTTISGGLPASPGIDDLNTTLFPGSNLDSRSGSINYGYFRTFVIGTRGRAYLASDSLYHSRNLRVGTLYYMNITCGATTSATLNFMTSNMPIGVGETDPWPADPSAPGTFAVPSTPGSNPPGNANPGEQWTDPQTGVLTQRLFQPGQSVTFTGPNYFTVAYNQGLSNFFTDATTPTAAQSCPSVGPGGNNGYPTASTQTTGDMTGSPWTNPCNALGNATGQYATVAGSNGWLVLRPSDIQFFSNYLSTSAQSTDAGAGANLQSVQVSLKGHCTSSNASLCIVQVCLSNNGGASCATNPSSWQSVTLPNGSDQIFTVGNGTPGTYGYDPMLYNANPRLARWRVNTRHTQVTTSGSTVTRKATLPITPSANNQDYFIDDYTTGGQGRIRLSTSNLNTTCNAASSLSNEFFISSGFGQSVNLTTSPGSPTEACMPNWAVMIRRQNPDVGSTVQIQNVFFNYLSNYNPGWWDTGFESFCDPTSIQSGWLCVFFSNQGGTFVDWINPANGLVNMVSSSGLNSKGTGANTWADGIQCPSAANDLFQTFDTSLSLPTWYCMIKDAAGNFVITQVNFTSTIFTSNSNIVGGKIGQGNVTTDDYSMNFAGTASIPGVAIRDLTPTCVNTGPVGPCAGGSPNLSLNAQIASFSGMAFDQYAGQSGNVGMSCALGTAQMGTVNFYCDRYNGSIGWIGVFSPGDSNPAHAGCAANTVNCNGIAGNNVGATPGPAVIGLFNSAWNSPASYNSSTGAFSVRWSNIHSVQDSGVSGHYDAGVNYMGSNGIGALPGGCVTGQFCFANGFQATTSVVTTNTLIPPTATDCATYGNPLGVTGTVCQQVQINPNSNGTVANQYEPYYAFLTPPQTQVTAELNTAAVGDIVCVAIFTDSCDFGNTFGGSKVQSATPTSWVSGVGVITLTSSGSGGVFTSDTTINVSGCSVGAWNASGATLVGLDSTNTKVYYNLASNPGGTPSSVTGCSVSDGTNSRNGTPANWLAGAAVYPIGSAIVYGQNRTNLIVSQCSNTAFNTNPTVANQLAYTNTNWATELDTNPGTAATGCVLSQQGSDIWRLIQKGANGLWVFQRNVPNLNYGNQTLPSWQALGNQPITISFWPSVINTNPANITTSGSSRWSWATDPTGQSAGGTVTNASCGGHGYGRPFNSETICTFPHSNLTAYTSGYNPNFTSGGVSTTQYVTASPTFNGTSPNVTSAWQSHPSPPGDQSPYTFTAHDFRPLQGNYTSAPSDSTLFSLVNGATQLYVATPSTVTDADDYVFNSAYMTFHRKLFATHALSTYHPLIDVSGIGSSIADGSANAYQYCIVRIAGECFAGSTVGQVYANVPGLSLAFCYGNFGLGQTLSYINDLCISDMMPNYQADMQFLADRFDTSGTFQRAIVKTMTGQGRMLMSASTGPDMESVRNLPDNSWTLFGCRYFDGIGHDTCMARMPYLVLDDVTRTTYVPYSVQVSIPAALGANNIIAQFGYQELAQGGVQYCTTRLDKCFATAATVPQTTSPFKFQSDGTGQQISGITGLACTTSCTISIPAMSQRILYYQILYRNAANAIIGQGNLMAVATP